MEWIEAHDSPQVLDDLGRAAVMDQRDTKTNIGEVRVQLESALELRHAFGSAVLPVQDERERYVRIRQITVQLDGFLRQAQCAINRGLFLVLARDRLGLLPGEPWHEVGLRVALDSPGITRCGRGGSVR